jgi:hypothetical protein
MRKQLIEEDLVKGGCGHSAEELVDAVVDMGKIVVVTLIVGCLAALGGCIS